MYDYDGFADIVSPIENALGRKNNIDLKIAFVANLGYTKSSFMSKNVRNAQRRSILGMQYLNGTNMFRGSGLEW